MHENIICHHYSRKFKIIEDGIIMKKTECNEVTKRSKLQEQNEAHMLFRS
jgi:hypothetical protein